MTRGGTNVSDCLNCIIPPPSYHPTGIIGTVRVTGFREGPPPPCGASNFDPWYVGPFGWLLADPVALTTPIEIPGKQGLWDVPEEYEAILGPAR